MKRVQWQITTVAITTVATVTFHYGFWGGHQHGGFLHAIHGRLCYIPIILAAIWFGIRGGMVTAAAITLMTLPYARVKGITDSDVLLGEYTEMVFYLAIGLMAGVLVEQQWRERRRNERLQRELWHRERLSSLGQMAAGLAHEVKNPLGSIQGAAEILGDDATDDPRKRELFDVLSRESRRLGAVVDHFLNFARPRPLNMAPLDLGESVTRAVGQMHIQAASRQIDIVPRIDAGLPAVTGDAEQIHQVLLNILLNAIAASPDGARIDVTVSSERRHASDTVVIRVVDRGDGIAEGDLERVFDPFFSTRESGSGLGLAISHTIVQDHGGSIHIDSRPGEGTTVAVTLPVTGR